MRLFKIPKPKGEFNVGTKLLHFVDENRNEIFAENGKNKRELMVQVWYPAENIKNKKFLSFIPKGKKMIKEIAKEFKIPEPLIDYLKYIKSNSYEDCEIASLKESYPLIILNHGIGAASFLHTTQAENLASNGYIVAAIDHTYSTAVTIFPDGRTTNFVTTYISNSIEERNNVMKVWVEDIWFVLEQFELLNSGNIESIFNDKIDLSNIGAFGHSFGGAASYDSCHDNRIKAGINLDGSLSWYEDKESVTKPFMFIYGEERINMLKIFGVNYTPSDKELESMNYTREEYEKEKKEVSIQLNQEKTTLANGGILLYIKGTKHYNFNDLQLVSPLTKFMGLTGKINGKRSTYIINQYILDFFNKYLKNEGGNLLKGENDEYHEVKFPSSIY